MIVFYVKIKVFAKPPLLGAPRTERLRNAIYIMSTK